MTNTLMFLTKSRGLVIALLLVLSGCASHYPGQVQIEERSRGGASAPPAGESSPATAQPAETGIRVYPTGGEDQRGDSAGTIESAPEQRSSVPSSAQSPSEPPPQPSSLPPSSATATVPQGALLALLEKAEQQHQSGQTQQALSSLERAQRIAPREPLVYLQLARLRRDVNDVQGAEQLARKGLSLSSGNREMQKAFIALLETLKR